ncbi:MAG TPA: hypothetical protein EYQ53_01600 [Candidatus Poseidoniales archaeon]|nr:MAG: hypothetical protein CXT69_03565 [Euryarchaeota archaeon]HIG03067.1 hypothetical protein [Candidatus Poseidoniales archaeon]
MDGIADLVISKATLQNLVFVNHLFGAIVVIKCSQSETPFAKQDCRKHMGSNISRNMTAGLGLFLTLLMLASTINITQLSSPLEVEEADGRQAMEVDCSSYTFEELFIYDHALYSLSFDSDWQTAWLEARAWVNGSNSAELRANLDGLLDGVPGGNNSWLSTDEREAVREVGPDCVGDMATRIGIREGVSHRSSSADSTGIDWNDLEWYSNGIVLDEVNLIPTGHSQERSCQNLGSSTDCKEVPVSITDNMELLIEEKAGEDKNIDFNKLPNNGQSNFTLAINTTNMTSTTFQITFPAINGLRISAWEVTEDGVTIDSTSEPNEIIGGDGSLTVIWENTYDSTDWPMVQELFIDFTTHAPDTNDPPVWAASAPTNGTLIPFVNEGSEVILLTASQMSSMAIDDDPVSISCEGPIGWIFSISLDGDLMVTPNGESADVTCVAVDRYDVESDSRTWKVAQPFSLSATTIEDIDSIDITIEPSSFISGLDITMSGVQDGRSSTVISESGISSSTMKTLTLAGLSPGDFTLAVSSTASGMLDWSANFDIGLSKLSQPPVVTLGQTLAGDNGTWDSSGYTYSISGTFYDADGEAVSFVLSVCGFPSQNINQQGANWNADVSVAGCTDHSAYLVTLTATDESGASSILEVNVLPPGASPTDNSGGSNTSPPEAEGGLPAPGIVITITSLLGAVLFFSRREE